MSNGVGSRVETGAVTVIGLGEAGNRMLGAVRDTVERSGTDTPFNYLAIDSRADDLELVRSIPDEARRIHLEPQPALFDVARESHSYLTEKDDIELNPAGGATRQRPVGRWFADNPRNIDEIVFALREALDSGAESLGHGSVQQVWLVHSLGGGTGSGLFPLVAALIDSLSSDLKQDPMVCGLGSLPRLDRLEASAIPPAGPRDYYLNSYTALRELATLVDHDDEGVYPLSIDVEAESNQLVGDTLELESSPFDAYGLLGVDVAEMASSRGGSYREHKNRTAASTIYALSQKELFLEQTGLARFGPIGAAEFREQERLFSVDSHRIRAPAAELEEYAELRAELDDTEERINQLNTEQTAIRESLQYLNQILDSSTGLDEIPHGDELSEEVSTVAERLCHSPSAGGGIEDAVLDLRSIPDTPEHVDAEPLATLVLTRELSDQLDSALSEHPFPVLVDEALREYGELLDNEPLGLVSSNDRLEIWKSSLSEELRRYRNRLAGELDESVFGVLKFGARAELEELTENLGELESAGRSYEALQELRDSAETRFRSTRESLIERRQTLEEKMDRTRDELDASNARVRRLEQELDSLTERLEATRTAGTTVIPAQNPERFSEGVLDRADGFRGLVDAGHLVPDDVESALDGSTQTLRESIQDRPEPYMTRSFRSFLTLLGSYESYEQLEDIEEGVRPSPPAEFDSVDRVDAETPFLFTALAIHTPIALKNTSEFGTLHEHYTDPDRNLSSQFSGEVTDEMVTEGFAYPELVE